MKTISKSVYKNFTRFVFLLAIIVACTDGAFAQCSTTAAPTYTESCDYEWYVSMSASGTGVASTISLTGGTCSGSGPTSYYFNDYATQGVTAPAGNTVSLAVKRYTTHYTAYLSVYIDWNNDGIYETSELAGSTITLAGTPAPPVDTTNYPFTVPTTGVVTGTNLHMRAMLTEDSAGTALTPCAGTYGQTYDYYLNVTCPVGIVDSIFTTDTTSFCFGDTAQLHGLIDTGETYQWYNAGTLIPGATDSTYSVTATGSYSQEITNALGCSSASNTIAVTVFNPTPVITFNGKYFHTDSDYVTYQWYRDSVVISGATRDSVLADSNGYFIVKVTDSNGCTGTSAVFHLYYLAVQNISSNTGIINVYPNPASSIIYIQSAEDVDAILTGMEGKIILRQAAAKQVDVSALPHGIYFIELFDESGHRLTVQKIIKD